MLDMQPQVDDDSIRLPITFDYKGGRRDNKRSNILATIVLTLVTIILLVGFARNDNIEWYMRIVICVVLFFGYSFFIRFKVFGEAVFSDAYETLKEVNWSISVTSFWGIYEIDSHYPFVCHFKDGKKGIFVKMERDCVVGKPDTVLFDHYEGISDAYCIAASLNLNLAHIDYMDNVGNDPRLESLYENLGKCSNPDLRELLLYTYGNLQDEMSEEYSCFDVYLLTSKSRVDQLWYNTQLVCNKFLAGNYLSYKVLNKDGIRATTMSLLNLKDFSVLDACEETLRTNNSLRGIVPIKVDMGDGTVSILNKTQAELEETRKRLEREAFEAKSKKREKKSGTIKVVPEVSNNNDLGTASVKHDDIDLFD